MEFYKGSRNILTSCLVLISESRTFFLGALSLAFSRLFQLLTFFLPLKILITVSSGHEPSYIRWLPWNIDFDYFLALLLCMVPLSYFMYIVFGIFSRYSFDISSEYCVNNRAIKLKSKEEKRIRKIHSHLGKAGAESLLCILSLILVTAVDVYLFLIMAILVFITMVAISKTALKMNDLDRFGFFKLHRRQCIEYFISINFIVMFIVILIIVKYFDIGIVEAIFALLISRMFFQALQRYCVEILYINGQSITKG